MASKKKKEKRSIPGFPWVLDCTFANFFRSCSKFFSALKIEDNSKFNKGQGRDVQIKDGWQPYLKRLVKVVRLLFLLIEMMKIVRLTSLLPDMTRLSSPRPKLRHGRRLALLSLLNLTPLQNLLNFCEVTLPSL